MSYLQKNSNFEERRNNIRRKIIFTVIGIIVIIVILSTGPMKRSLFFIAEPVWKIKNTVLDSDLFEYFKSKQVLINDRLAIEQRLFLAGNLLAENNILRNENETLKVLLGRKELKQKTILASILVKPPQTPYDMLTIDIGEDNNIKVGDLVIANANIYIGEIAEIYPHSAKIILYSTPNHKTSVLLGTNSVSVEAIGIGGGNFNIFLPREIEVKENDALVFPSIITNIFGIVEKINFSDKDSFQTVLFKSPVNISELSFVEIILQ